MASEKIKVDNGNLVVDRSGVNKSTLEIPLSDVDSVSFERGGEGEGQSDGTLVLNTKDGDRYTVRVADDEVGKYLKQIYSATEEKPAARKTQKVVDSEPVNAPADSDK
jgi:hypothetical protein